MFYYPDPAAAAPTGAEDANLQAFPRAKRASSRIANRPGTWAEHHQAVTRAIQAMHERLGEPLSLAEMADVAALSPYHFNRVFRQLVGIPPSQFLYALRLQAAKRLLMTSDLSVTDVCFEVGYNSLGTFCTRFTDLVGLSPRRLRHLSPGACLTQLNAMCQHHHDAHAKAPPEPGITGQVAGTHTGPVAIGLFRDPIPQGAPVRCTVLARPGAYHISGIPDGVYHVFATALPQSEDTLAFMLPDEAAMEVGAGQNPVKVEDGQASDQVDIELRSRLATDPPLLIALPGLLAKGAAPRYC